MRTLIFGTVLIAGAYIGFNALLSTSLAAARDAREVTFSERLLTSAHACVVHMHNWR